MDKKAITLQQLEEALRDLARWIRDKLRGYVAEPETEGKNGYVLTTNGAGGRSWEPGGAEEPDKTLSIEGTAADAKAVGEKKADKPKTDGIMKAVNGSLVAADAGVDYQAPIEAGEITAEKIADASVQRSKLATDALYSPWKAAQGSTDITAADIGCTFKNGYGQTYELVIAQANSASIPEGAEIAAYAYGEADAVLTVKAEGVRLLLDGDETLYPSGTTVRVAGANSMIALKKFLTSAANGDVWIITGNVEVVS